MDGQHEYTALSWPGKCSAEGGLAVRSDLKARLDTYQREIKINIFPTNNLKIQALS